VLDNPASPTPEIFRRDLTAWLDANADELTPPYEGAGSMDEQMGH